MRFPIYNFDKFQDSWSLTLDKSLNPHKIQQGANLVKNALFPRLTYQIRTTGQLEDCKYRIICPKKIPLVFA